MGLALPEIKQKGWDALVKELGYAGATKFILLYEPGKGDYTQERKNILKEITIEKLREDILKD
jgi:tagatose-1,6-bisphosphate aldolase